MHLKKYVIPSMSFSIGTKPPVTSTYFDGTLEPISVSINCNNNRILIIQRWVTHLVKWTYIKYKIDETLVKIKITHPLD